MTLPGTDILRKAIDAENVTGVREIIRKCGLNREVWHGGYIPFMYAYQNAKFQCALQILMSGIPHRLPENQHQLPTLFHVVASSNSAMLFSQIYDRCPELIDTPNICGETPLHVAIRHKNLKCIVKLLSKNAKVNHVSSTGKTPLLSSIENFPSSNVSLLDLLLKNGADVALETRHGLPFHLAVCSGDKKKIDLFLKHGVDVNVRNSEGDAALHVVCKKAYTDCFYDADYILEYGANPNAVNNEKKTPLYYAVKKGDFLLVKILLHHGIDENLEENKKAFSTSIELFCEQKKDAKLIMYKLLSYGFNFSARDAADEDLLVALIKAEDTMNLKALLDLGADVNGAYKYENTLLQLAIESKATSSIKLLLNRGADVNMRGNTNTSCLKLAIQSLELDLIKELVEKGAVFYDDLEYGLNELHYAVLLRKEDVVSYFLSQNADVNKKTKDGHTPLHFAASKGNIKAVSMLLEHGANVNAVSENKSTPLLLAVKAKFVNTAIMLMNYGADVNAKDAGSLPPLYLAANAEIYPVVVALLLREADLKAIRYRNWSSDIWTSTRLSNPFPLTLSNDSVYGHLHEEVEFMLDNYPGELSEDTCYDKCQDQDREYFKDYRETSYFVGNNIEYIFEGYSKFKEDRKRILGMNGEELDRSMKKKAHCTRYNLMREALLMRETVIFNGVTLYDLLTRDLEEISRLLFGRKIDGKILLREFKRYGYYTLLRNKIRAVEDYNSPMCAGLELNQFWEVELPVELVHEIVEYLAFADVKNVLRATGYDQGEIEVEEKEEMEERIV